MSEDPTKPMFGIGVWITWGCPRRWREYGKVSNVSPFLDGCVYDMMIKHSGRRARRAVEVFDCSIPTGGIYEPGLGAALLCAKQHCHTEKWLCGFNVRRCTPAEIRRQEVNMLIEAL